MRLDKLDYEQKSIMLQEGVSFVIPAAEGAGRAMPVLPAPRVVPDLQCPVQGGWNSFSLTVYFVVSYNFASLCTTRSDAKRHFRLIAPEVVTPYAL